MPLSLRHPSRVFWLVASATVLFDQVTKSLVRVLWDSAAASPIDFAVSRIISPAYSAGESVPVLTEVLKISYVRNTGAAFGLLPGYRPVFIATSLIVLVVVAAYWRRWRPEAWPVVIGVAFVTGGALGNLIDRALFGRVTDFVDFAAVGFPVFNVADSGIVVGVSLLVFWLLFGPQPAPGVTGGPNADAETHTDRSAAESSASDGEPS